MDKIFWTLGYTNTLELRNLDAGEQPTLCISMDFIAQSMYALFSEGMEEFKNYLIENDLYDESDQNSDITK